MTLAMRREFQFLADKRFRVKLTPMSNAVLLPRGLLDCLVPSLRLGMLVFEAPPLELAAEPPGAAFSASGRNEVLKEFQLKLIPMSIAVPLPNTFR
ncbi:hypothetical protein [Nostoc sp.]|uniref:hypothetical protein n=1 Tax=Nostoc sp. TaxID=1180 RepID=UPI002FF8854C